MFVHVAGRAEPARTRSPAAWNSGSNNPQVYILSKFTEPVKKSNAKLGAWIVSPQNFSTLIEWWNHVTRLHVLGATWCHTRI